MSTIINATTTNGVVIQPDNSGSLQLATNSGTTAVTINTSQNVGIGTTSPATVLHTYSSNAGTPTTSGSATTGVSARFQNSSVNFDIGTYSSGECFIQPRLTGNNATNFGLTLNPNGGNVSISGNLLFNSGYGSVATAYGCRAWVNFNGTGTVAIRASGNVTSITDNGTGDYTVNFTNAMPDVNYVGVFGPVIRSGPDANCMVRYGNAMGTYALTTTTYRFGTGEIGAGFTGQDAVAVQASFFR
jgi:hypothetical protein